MASLLVGIAATGIALHNKTELKWLDIPIISAVILLTSTHTLCKILALQLPANLRGMHWVPHVATPVLLALNIAFPLLPIAVERLSRERDTNIIHVTTFILGGVTAALFAARVSYLIPKVLTHRFKVILTLSLFVLNDVISPGLNIVGAWYEMKAPERKPGFDPAYLRAILLALLTCQWLSSLHFTFKPAVIDLRQVRQKLSASTITRRLVSRSASFVKSDEPDTVEMVPPVPPLTPKKSAKDPYYAWTKEEEWENGNKGGEWEV